MAAQDPVQHIFEWAEICEIARLGSEITSKAANKTLKKFREEASGQKPHDGPVPVTVEAKDLTDRAEFDWCSYLKKNFTEKECKQIVGKGVTKFELRFLQNIDPNTHQRRLDFIVHRLPADDDTPDFRHPHVRLHPSKVPMRQNGTPSRTEALPCFGYLTDWTGETIPGISRGDCLKLLDVKHAVPQQDVIGRIKAGEFLEHLNSTRMEHVVDLTDGSAFPWQRYLRSSDTFKVDASKHCCCDTTGHQGPREREDGGSSCVRRVSEVLRLGRASVRARARARARAMVDELLGRLGLVASGQRLTASS
jgi:hypothetical protein